MKTITYDICGQVCPSSLLIALKEINDHQAELRNREVQLSFRTDNRDAVVTIPESAGNMGYAVSVEKGDDCYIIGIRRA